MKNNLVAIVGKPNVGKSSLFNRLVGSRMSITDKESGITRDRLYQEVNWLSKKFQIIDTGGIEVKDVGFQKQIKAQVDIAIEEASVILFVVDGQNGLDYDDKWISSLLRKTNKKVFLVVNKLENNQIPEPSVYTTGFEKLFFISAMHNQGVGDLLDEIIDNITFKNQSESKVLKLAIVGRPNAGKSSLLNALVNEKRSIVSSIPGTTRDSVNSFLKIEDNLFELIDTAGIKRKSKLVESVEHYALVRAFDSLEKANIIVLLLDASKELTHFDARILGYAMENKKPIIIALNKWDLIKKSPTSQNEYEKQVRKEFKFASWAPVVFISALKKQNLHKLTNKMLLVKDNLQKRISTSVLNGFFMEIQTLNSNNAFKGGRLNISFVKQIDDDIPHFLLFVNNPKYLHFSYRRYLENKIREYFGFEGVPIKIEMRKKNEK